jgi:hypothetical protein
MITFTKHKAMGLEPDIELCLYRDAKSEIEKWISNHNEMVRRNALLRERPDLPVDRIPAHNELIRLQDEVKELKYILEGLRE